MVSAQRAVLPSAVPAVSAPTRLRLPDLLHATDRYADDVLSGRFDHLLPDGGPPIDDRWFGLPTDPDAVFDREVVIDVAAVKPQVTWGTNPGMVVPIDAVVPEPADEAVVRALTYMGLEPGTPVRAIHVDRGQVNGLQLTALHVPGEGFAVTISFL